MKPGEGTTIIGRAAKLRGDLLSTEDLQVDGEVEGTIRLSGGRLTVGPEARIRADVYAPDVIIFGKVEGDIWAPGRVDLRSSAVVVGDVYAGRLSIEENATLSGQVDPSRANEAPPASSTSGSTAGAVRPGLGSASGTLSALPRRRGQRCTRAGRCLLRWRLLLRRSGRTEGRMLRCHRWMRMKKTAAWAQSPSAAAGLWSLSSVGSRRC